MKKRGIEEDEGGVSRRTFLKGAMAAGAAGFLGAAGYGTVRSLIAPELALQGELFDTFMYILPAGAEVPQWYVEQGLVGREARLSHFEERQGALVLWKIFRNDEGEYIPGSGFPGLLMRWDPEELSFPDSPEYNRDDFVIDGLYAIFNCCTHACCRPGWNLRPEETIADYLGYNNIFCECHVSQYNPRILSIYRHPPPPESTGAEYVGVHKDAPGPAPRGMPLIPIHLEGDVIMGTSENDDWYRYLDFKASRIPTQEGG